MIQSCQLSGGLSPSLHFGCLLAIRGVAAVLSATCVEWLMFLVMRFELASCLRCGSIEGQDCMTLTFKIDLTPPSCSLYFKMIRCAAYTHHIGKAGKEATTTTVSNAFIDRTTIPRNHLPPHVQPFTDFQGNLVFPLSSSAVRLSSASWSRIYCTHSAPTTPDESRAGGRSSRFGHG
jgi:hypothetical protein